MEKIIVLLLVALACTASSLPLDTLESDHDALSQIQTQKQRPHSLWKRFINPLFSSGIPDTDNIIKMRTKRSYDECEKLQLCKLHARSRQSFFATFELYFVNKENARLWDHRARSPAECEARFGDCYDKK